MMMLRKLQNPALAADLFAGWEETLITSCTQGVMGSIYVSEEQPLQSAAAVLGVFAFFGGKPEKKLLQITPADFNSDVLILVPQNKEWENLMSEYYGDFATKQMRYAIKKEPDCFDVEKLRAFIQMLPQGYQLQQINEELYHKCFEMDWSRDFVAQFPTYEMYQRYGLGYVITKEGELVAGASSYSGYRGGIEIEIVTKEEYRREGFATINAAALILECLARGLYPSCDAQNLWSVGLAEKLGYHFSHEYPVFILKSKH